MRFKFSKIFPQIELENGSRTEPVKRKAVKSDSGYFVTPERKKVSTSLLKRRHDPSKPAKHSTFDQHESLVESPKGFILINRNLNETAI